MKIFSDKKKLVTIVLALIIIASAAFVLYQNFGTKKDGLSAVVSVKGVDVCAIALSETGKSYDFDLNDFFGIDVILEIDKEKIKFKHSNCPDQICVHAGWQSRDMDIAVCMPNEVAVIVVPTSEVPK